MYVVCVDFVIEPDRVADFMPLMRQQAKNSISLERGCRRFDVCTTSDDPSKVFLYEIYDDQDAFNAHLKTDHYAEFDRAVSGLVKEKAVRFFVLNES